MESDEMMLRYAQRLALTAVALLLGMFAMGVAFGVFADVPAGRPTFDWDNPMAWTNGNALAPAQITGYQLECTGAQNVSARLSDMPATYPPPSSSALPAGGYTCTLAVFARETPTSEEAMSAPSGAVSFTVPQSAPNVATGLSVD